MSTSDPHTYVPARERTGSFGRFQLRPSHLITDVPRSIDGAAQLTGTASVEPAQAHAAALQVCSRASDADEARRLLAMLGLTEVTR